jgi:hypothetical protein
MSAIPNAKASFGAPIGALPKTESACPEHSPAKKTKPTLKEIKDGKKIAMKKKINIGFPISNQIYVFYLKPKYYLVKRTYL